MDVSHQVPEIFSVLIRRRSANLNLRRLQSKLTSEPVLIVL